MWRSGGTILRPSDGFNPHTHEGCDQVNCHRYQNCSVSIHTPTKGVTWCQPKYSKHCFVSIHTPTKGVTNASDPRLEGVTVSIHTPTKGVTNKFNERMWNMQFQSTHPRRVWQDDTAHGTITWEFQSTHPRRVWRSYPSLSRSVRCVSIHTPTKGVTGVAVYTELCGKGFNPHTHEGCDYWVKLPPSPYHSFNPHTHEGCDIQRKYRKALKREFQSTHPRRVWLAHESGELRYTKVSIHTPTKGVTLLLCEFKSIREFQSTHPRRVWQYIY